MERNQAIGLVLISAMMMLYLWMNKGDEKALEPQDISKTEQVDSLTTTSTQNVTQKNDSAASEEITTQETLIKVITKDLTVTLSNFGATVESVRLNNFTTHISKTDTLFLIKDQSSAFNIKILNGKTNLDFKSIAFVPSNKNRVIDLTKGQSGDISFVSDQGVIINYSFKNEGYEVGYSISAPSLTGKSAIIDWAYEHQIVEDNVEYSRTRTGISYYTSEGDFDQFGEGGSAENEVLEENVKWIAHKQRFFLSALIDETGYLQKPKLGMTVADDEDLSTLKNTTINTDFTLAAKNDFKFYFGPNDYKIADNVTDGFEKNIYLGWGIFSYVNKWLVIPIFHFLEKFMSNYGLIILCLVIIIKMLLFPIAYKSYLSMAKMKELKPEIDEIKERTGGDQTKTQQETMKLYSKAGVSPLSGCIPMVLQMPILFALFNFFPNSIELRHEQFLWAHDLSTYDNIINWTTEIPFLGNHLSLFTVLMTISTIAYTYYNNQINSASMQGPMKSIGYVMPVIFLFVLNNFSAGLTFYYFVSNLITISQQLIATRFIDKEKIRKTIDENKKNHEQGKSKKSKFQQRLDDAMKAQQEAKKNKK